MMSKLDFMLRSALWAVLVLLAGVVAGAVADAMGFSSVLTFCAGGVSGGLVSVFVVEWLEL